MKDAEYLFIQEIQEKKRAARGASHRASRKKGYKGNVKTAYDFMTAKQRKELNGKVRCFNVDDQIIDLIAFKLLPRPEQTTLLVTYLSKYTKEEIAKAWGCSKGNVDAWRATVGLSKMRDLGSKGDTKKKVSKAITKSLQAIVNSTYDEVPLPTAAEVTTHAQGLVERPIPMYVSRKKSFSLRLEKEMLGSEIKDALLSYASILDDTKLYDLLVDISGD